MANSKNIKLKKRFMSIHHSDRNKVQWFIFIITILAGIQFTVFISSLELTGNSTVSKPQAVDGFLPIGSLVSLKYYFKTGIFDHVHPAGVVILLFAVLLSFLLKKAFCSWFCPVGTLSEWVWKFGYRIFSKSVKPSKWIDIPLRSLKYLLMYFFVLSVLEMDEGYMTSFLNGQYWKVADVKMLLFFTGMSGVTILVLILLVAGSLFIRNFWCRYLCPYGAFLGIFSLISPSRIARNSESCTDCGLCSQVCPAYLPVDKKEYIISAECTGCVACSEACPVKNTLEFETLPMRSSFWTARRLAFFILCSFLILVVVSKAFGIWESNVASDEIIKLLPRIETISH